MDTTTITEAYGLTISGDPYNGYRIYDKDDHRITFNGEVVEKFAVKQEAEHFAYDYNLKMQDPEPYIDPRTMERSATGIAGSVSSYYNPRLTWPTHGGRMVRRDHLRVGDMAVSSHYGARKVKSIRQGGFAGQTTTITWEGGTEAYPFTEIYPSDLSIEMLPEGWTR